MGIALGEQKNAWLAARRPSLAQPEPPLCWRPMRPTSAPLPAFGLTEAEIDRLRLDAASGSTKSPLGLEEVAALPDPVGEVIEASVRPNGLEVSKVRVPLGVVFFIYESRPNVTADAAAMCVKSGNAVILRGGKEALHSQPGDRRDPATRRPTKSACRPTPCSWSNTPDRAAVGHLLALPRVHRPGDSARRREPDPPRRRRSEDAGHQALHGQLPRLRRSRRPTWTWPSGSSSTPSASGWASATRPNRCWCTPTWPTSSCRGLARHWQRSGVEMRGDERTLRSWCPARSRRPTRITRPSFLDLIISVKVVGSTRRGDRAHQPLRLEAHRRDRDAATWPPPASLPPAWIARP